MKHGLLLFGALALTAANVGRGSQPATASFAVVELFTSEGCSSCPPADKLLAELAGDAKTNSQRIFFLAFHVDYWNSLGWTDPFSSAAYSDRQQQYSRALGLDQIYTPQMIVNGTVQFVGSDRTRARKAIASALGRPAKATLVIKPTSDATGSKVEYHISNAPKNARLCIALVESGLVSQVRRGENAGRTLSHTNVVREFITVALNDTGTGTVKLKTNFPDQRKDMQVMAFLQDQRTLEILGATSSSP